MPVINGVYTKDFPALGRAPIDADIIPIAEVANQITYKTTIGAIFNAKLSGTSGRLSKFTSANTLGNSILNEIGNAIHLTNSGSSFASFGIINPGTPGDPGVDNDCFIGSTINNDFTIRVNNTEAARFDTALRFKIANISNATTDTDKFLVSDGGVVKYRTGAEVLADIGGASATGFVPYTGATQGLNLGTNNALTLADTGSNTSINVTSSSSGQGAILVTKSGNGEGVRVLNNGIGAAFLAQNTSTGIGFYINNGSTGIGLRINNDTSAIGDPFIYTLSGNLKAKIDYLGNITGNSFIKSGGLSTEFLKADGSVDSNSYALSSSLTGYVTLDTAQTITGAKSFTANVTFGVGSPTAIESATGRIITDKFRLYNSIPATNYHDFASSASQNRTITVPDATGTMALTSDLGAYLPLTGGTLTSSGSANTLNINHTSGSGIALNILKNGNGEGLTIVKGSGSGNAASITGGITLLSELNLTTKLADAHIASADTWNAKIGGSGTTNYLAKFTASGTVGNSAVQEVNGNLGLGVTPSAWASTWRAIQLVGGSLYTNAGGTTGQIGIGQNWYFDGSSNKYLNNAAASDYYQFAGEHRWFTAPSGTAGNAISFTQAMTLTAGGELLIGTTTDNGYPLEIEANASGNHMYLKRSAANTDIFMGGTTGAGTVLYVRSNGSGGVSLSSGATSWAAVSDENEKEMSEFVEFNSALDKVKSLRAGVSRYKTDEIGVTRSFLIAQDVQKVLPEAISVNEEGILSLRYTDLIPLLVASIKEQQTQIEELKALINK